MRVSASDEDADNNGAIIYSLTAPVNPNDLEYFEIQAESGWIVLKKPLDVSAFVPLLFSSVVVYIGPLFSGTSIVLRLIPLFLLILPTLFMQGLNNNIAT